jgi:hypothetical protein
VKYDYGFVVLTIYRADYLSMARCNIMFPHPHFKYMLSSPHHYQYGYITLGNEKVHHIGDVHEFYRALGYNDEISKTGLLPEEFVCFEFHKDKNERPTVCLQVKIIEYLNKHSPTFKKNYAVENEHWLASCIKRRANNSTKCTGCIADNK